MSANVDPDMNPWRGSAIEYGQSATAYSFKKDAQYLWDPTWSHHLVIRPEWHFGKQVYLRGNFDLAQEFTLSDSTTYRNEVVWGDPYIDVGAAGWKDPWAGIRIAGSLRLTAGVSKAAQSETRVFSVAPGASVSRHFDVLSGLTIAYDARLNENFLRYTTHQQDSSDVAAFCSDPTSLACLHMSQTGERNVHTELLHGASVQLAVHPKVTLSGSFSMYRGWLYDLPAEGAEGVSYVTEPDANTRDAWGTGFAATWQFLPEVSATLGASTFSLQRNLESQLQSPLFNRYTNLYLDLGLDVEALLKRI